MHFNSAIMWVVRRCFMKICKKKSNTGQSLYVVIPQDQLKLVDFKEGDNICVVANEKKKEIVIKKFV